MSRIEDRLAELGITLPPAPQPVAAYVPGVLVNGMVYTAGQLPLVDGKLRRTGAVGRELTVEESAAEARVALLNALAVVKSLAGDLDQVERVVKLNGWVACTEAFTEQPKVMNGASELLVEIFGEAGRHARASVGTNALPLGAAVELELIVKVR